MRYSQAERFTGSSPQGAVGLQKALLCQIAGFLGVPHQAVDVVVDAGVVRVEHLFEGVAVAIPDALC
jgi:hypothetical protein